MGNLYNQLSTVYEAMYQSFIPYREEFLFYSDVLKRYDCSDVLEIGCGTGNLASLFTANGFRYYGMDLSEDMLLLAQTKNPSCRFLRADMRNFTIEEKINAAIITGRTISYVVTNEDVVKTFEAIYRNLEQGGIVCFDFIDAERFIPSIKNGKRITHTAEWKGQQYLRESLWTINYDQSWTFNWHSVYFQLKEHGEKELLGEDDSTIRTFTREDIRLFLQLPGFSVLEMIDRPSYAFDTFVVIARK